MLHSAKPTSTMTEYNSPTCIYCGGGKFDLWHILFCRKG